jgi:hypothetical protein
MSSGWCPRTPGSSRLGEHVEHRRSICSQPFWCRSAARAFKASPRAFCDRAGADESAAAGTQSRLMDTRPGRPLAFLGGPRPPAWCVTGAPPPKHKAKRSPWHRKRPRPPLPGIREPGPYARDQVREETRTLRQRCKNRAAGSARTPPIALDLMLNGRPLDDEQHVRGCPIADIHPWRRSFHQQTPA